MSLYLELLYVNRRLKKLEKNSHPEPKKEAPDTYPSCDTDRGAALRQLHAIERRISAFDKLQSQAVDPPSDGRNTRSPRYFDPSLQDRLSQILSEVENTRAWLEKEEWDTPVIDASTLSKEERFEVVKKSYDCRAEYIARTVMPRDELDRVSRHDYGVKIDDILRYYNQKSHKSVENAFSKHSPSWNKYRLHGLNSCELDPLWPACDLYEDGRRHLTECLDDLIYGEHIPDIEDSETGGCGLLKEGQYTKRHREFWWIQAKRYSGVLSALLNNHEELVELIKRRPRAGNARSAGMKPSSTAGIKRSFEGSHSSEQSHKRQKQQGRAPERPPGREEGAGKHGPTNITGREQSPGHPVHPNSAVLRTERRFSRISPRRSARIAARQGGLSVWEGT